MLSTMTDYFMQAERYTKGREGRPLAFVGLHSMEAPETATMAEWCIDYFARNPDNRNSSTHYAIDNNSVAAGVSESDTAWTIGNYRMNCGSINIELAGYAKQDRAMWLDAYSVAQRKLTAKLIADILRRTKIPNRYATDDDIREYVKNPLAFPLTRGGIITHGQVTRALNIVGGHTDPGPNYPLDLLRKDIIALLAPTYPYPFTRTLRRGNTGSDVRRLQQMLGEVVSDYWSRHLGIPDGSFGLRTEEVVKAFQKARNLPVTGVANITTLNVLDKAYDTMMGL